MLALVEKYSGRSAEAFNKPLFSLKRCESVEEKGGNAEFRQNLGSGIEALLNQERPPGTIFVFSDFLDGFTPDYMKDIQSLARRKKCKVVFWYPFDDKNGKWLGARKHYIEFAKATRGEVKEEQID